MVISFSCLQVICRNDRTILEFPKTIESAIPAAKKTFEMIDAEIKELQTGFTLVRKVASTIKRPDAAQAGGADPASPTPRLSSPRPAEEGGAPIPIPPLSPVGSPKLAGASGKPLSTISEGSEGDEPEKPAASEPPVGR
jgi:hypothetical protein